MVRVFQIVAVVSLIVALVSGVLAIAAIAEGVRYAQQRRHALSLSADAGASMMLSIFNPSALLALGAAGFASLLNRLDLLRETMRDGLREAMRQPSHVGASRSASAQVEPISSMWRDIAERAKTLGLKAEVAGHSIRLSSPDGNFAIFDSPDVAMRSLDRRAAKNVDTQGSSPPV
jgi:hypothetical protein